MGKSVAVTGDVKAETASGFSLTGPIVEQYDPKLTVGGKPVVVGATAAWANSSGTADTATLVGGGKLQHAAAGVLLDGDEASGTQGNKLTVSASGKLKVG